MSTPWREMPEFAGIDLEDSRVLGWRYESDRLVVALETRLLPEHPAYSAPLFGETGCNRPGRLVFDRVRRAEGLHPPLSDFLDVADDEPRVDTLAYLRRDDDGGYSFDATWGTIRVYCDDLRLAFGEDSRAAA